LGSCVAHVIRKPSRPARRTRSVRLSHGARRTRTHGSNVTTGPSASTDERYRTLVNSLDAGFCVVEMKFDGAGSPIDYKFIEVNDAFVRKTGLHDATGKWMRTLAPDHEQHWFDIYGKVALSGEPIRFENKADALDHRWYDVHAFRIGPNQVGILFDDITSRKNTERQHKLLLEELGHRMTNTMTVVQAVANQTLRGVSDREAVEAFTRRLQALSTAQQVLFNQNWSSASLGDVVRTIAFAHAEPARFKLSGPGLSLDAKAALSISLLVHELATNALKYGALSVPEGVVNVNWSEVDGDLVLIWLENGGPTISPSSRIGFGSRLLEEGIVGTRQVEKSYSQSGFTATFRAPLTLIQSHLPKTDM
jgi:two-component system CheB/CheR fusion protein